MQLMIPKGDFEALIFDCDGTLAHSMPLHYEAWMAVLNPYDCTFTEQCFYDWAGMPPERILERLAREQNLPLPIAQLASSREEHFFNLCSRVEPIPAVIEQVHLHFGKKKLAVASGGHTDTVHRMLQGLNLYDRFDAIVCFEDYVNGKPAPDAFLTAAERLRVHPHKCLVFEDAEFGIQAAQAAGMAWVHVPKPIKPLLGV